MHAKIKQLKNTKQLNGQVTRQVKAKVIKIEFVKVTKHVIPSCCRALNKDWSFN